MRSPATKLTVVLASAWFTLLANGSALVSQKTRADEPLLTQTDVFLEGEQGYHTYRIPAMVISKKGTILAFCEARKNSSADHGDIDLVLRRSFDNGKTWGPMQIVHEEGGTARITIGQPTPIVERETGTIHLLFCRDNQQAFYTKSTDDGANFHHPTEITAAFADFDSQLASDLSQTKIGDRQDGLPFKVTRLATGPGHAIQTRRGRLLVPVWLNSYKVFPSSAGGPNEVIDYRYRAAVIYSDNNGLTWSPGKVIASDSLEANEAMVEELTDGSLHLNMRVVRRKSRTVAHSTDGGSTWSKAVADENLIDPECQAGLVRFTQGSAHRKNRLVFSNPASLKRERLTIKLSYDEGRSWPVAKLLNAGPSGYSDLAILNDMTIGCLYERGEQRVYQKLTFARFNLAWLTDGKDDLR
ncbi:MAG: exo-alpha-sialidase [Acidimicrobiia bacterium]|nr:exo-alpha-sialidase [Acidimicrobiia bacterium]